MKKSPLRSYSKIFLILTIIIGSFYYAARQLSRSQSSIPAVNVVNNLNCAPNDDICLETQFMLNKQGINANTTAGKQAVQQVTQALKQTPPPAQKSQTPQPPPPAPVTQPVLPPTTTTAPPACPYVRKCSENGLTSFSCLVDAGGALRITSAPCRYGCDTKTLQCQARPSFLTRYFKKNNAPNRPSSSGLRCIPGQAQSCPSGETCLSSQYGAFCVNNQDPAVSTISTKVGQTKCQGNLVMRWTGYGWHSTEYCANGCTTSTSPASCTKTSSNTAPTTITSIPIINSPTNNCSLAGRQKCARLGLPCQLIGGNNVCIEEGETNIISQPSPTNKQVTKPPPITLTPSQTTTMSSDFASMVEQITQVITACQQQGKGVGELLKTCFCQSISCAPRSPGARIIESLSAKSDGATGLECVEYVTPIIASLMSINPFINNNEQSVIPLDVAENLTNQIMSSDPGANGGWAYCPKPDALYQGDIIITHGKGEDDPGHIGICVGSSQTSCSLADANFSKDSAVKIHEFSAKNVVGAWRKLPVYKGNESEYKVLANRCYVAREMQVWY